ncbi:cell division protein CrgA [Frondihabitans cladoniiphilus]
MAKEKKTTARASDITSVDRASSENQANPVWFKPVMFGFMLLGLAWIIVFYVSQSVYPVPSLGSWNILVGFGIMFIGFLMTTRWR